MPADLAVLRRTQAGIALREDRYRIAHAHILTVAASPPADAATEYDLFQRLRTFNEHALMIDSAQRLLSLKPIDIGQQMQVASSLSGIGAPELAERVWERMQSREPRHVATLLTEGYLATNQGEFDRAERALEAAIARHVGVISSSGSALAERTRSKQAAKLGVKHLYTLTSQRNLAAVELAKRRGD